jgi:hypothetical protein
MRRRRLPHIRLGNPELSGNQRRRDASLEGCANGVHLATGQRNFAEVHLFSIIRSRHPFRRQVGCRPRRRRKICTNARRQSASAFRLVERHFKKLVQFSVTQLFDGVRQVLWQDMSGRSGGSYPSRRRERLCGIWRSISGRVGREQVGCCLLGGIASHGAIMTRSTSDGNTLLDELITLNAVLRVLRRRQMAPKIADQPLHRIWHCRSLRALLDAAFQRGTALPRQCWPGTC